jgi:hypothetical protein
MSRSFLLIKNTIINLHEII